MTRTFTLRSNFSTYDHMYVNGKGWFMYSYDAIVGHNWIKVAE